MLMLSGDFLYYFYYPQCDHIKLPNFFLILKVYQTLCLVKGLTLILSVIMDLLLLYFFRKEGSKIFVLRLPSYTENLGPLFQSLSLAVTFNSLLFVQKLE